MKKMTLFLILTCCVPHVFAHVAKKEVDKDQGMIEIDNKVRSLIIEAKDYDAALKVYALAARDNTDQSYYKDQYAILRRVIKMKKAMQAESMQGQLSKPQAKKWTSYYNAIRAYYYSQGFYGESAELDKQANQKLKTPQTATNYLETLIVLNKISEAQNLITASLSTAKDIPDFLVLQNLQLQRTDKTADTENIEKVLLQNAQDNPRGFVYLGCIYQLQNDPKKASKAIIKALESTPPTQIMMTRKLINKMAEFDSIRQSDTYVAALKTESKVYQSGCTGGSSCNSCSLKDTCPSNK